MATGIALNANQVGIGVSFVLRVLLELRIAASLFVLGDASAIIRNRGGENNGDDEI